MHDITYQENIGFPCVFDLLFKTSAFSMGYILSLPLRVSPPPLTSFHIHIYTHIFSLLVTLWVNGLRYFQMEHDGPSGSWDLAGDWSVGGGLTDLALECFRCSFDRNQVALTQRLCFSPVPMPYLSWSVDMFRVPFSKHSGRVMLLNVATAIWYILWLLQSLVFPLHDCHENKVGISHM